MQEMEAEELEELRRRLEEALDLCFDWASWWISSGEAGYVGAISPPIRQTRAAGVYPRLLGRAPRRVGRRSARAVKGNLRLPLG